MDFTALSPEEKVNKYLEFNGTKPAEGDSYLNYIPNGDKEPEPKDEMDNKMEGLNVLPTLTGKSKSKNPLLNFKVDTNPLGTVTPQVDKKGDVTHINIPKVDPDRGIGKFLDVMPLAKDLTAGQKKVIESIDNSHYDADMKKYLKILAYKESKFTTNLELKNQYGYQGIYQFGQGALDWVKMDRKTYLSSMEKQHEAAAKLGELNFKGLSKYVGQTIGGVKMTKSGLMAAAHLGGRGNLDKFLASNGKEDFKDGNNVPISHYMKVFGT